MPDPRVQSLHRITPPNPLPHVSRRALKRVKDWIPPPTQCPYCNGPVRLVSNKEVYGREYGDWPYAYACIPCSAHVGLHPSTDLPLGTLAKKDLRELRKRAKSEFIHYSELRNFDRNSAYEWLAGQMGIVRQECHFGFFREDQAQMALNICQANIKLQYIKQKRLKR